MRAWSIACAVSLAALVAAPALAEPLLLEVELNGRSTGLIVPFERDGDDWSADAAELAGLRIAARARPTAASVRLRDVAGLSWRYDEARQVMQLKVAPDRLLAVRIDASRAAAPDGATDLASSTGAKLGYSLYAGSGIDGRGLSSINASAALDARVYGPWGQGVASGIVAADARGPRAVRFDTSWTALIDHRTLAQVGDAITNSLPWSRSIRFGGVQVRRDFSLRPDLVTLPLPTVSGSAAVPSSLDLYLNGSLAQSGVSTEGRYQIDNLPVVTGGGDARIVLHDIQGREIETHQRFFVSDRQLREGLSQFSVETGVARVNYGVRSWDYDGRPFVSGSGRLGLGSGVTIEGHAEVASGLVLAGSGAVLPTGSVGVLSVAAAASRGDGREGMLFYGAFETGRGAFRLFAEAIATSNGYRDLATLTSRARRTSPTDPALALADAQPARLALRASASLPVPAAGGSFSLSFASEDRRQVGRYRTVSGFYGRSLGDRVSVQASVVGDLERRGGGGVFASLNLAFARRSTASLAVDRSAGSGRVAVEAAHAALPEPGGVDWRVIASGGDQPFQSALVRYHGRMGDAGAQFSRGGRTSFGDLTFDGALTIDHGLYATPPLTGAFAVVDAGAPDVAVLRDNQPVGRTDARGRLLVPNLRAFEHSQLSLDPETLPLDTVMPRVEQNVRPTGFGGVRVLFAADRMERSALVHLVDERGADLPVGATLVGEDGRRTVVGYDGLAMLSGLQPRNRYTVALAGETCAVRLDIDEADAGAGLRRIGPLTCFTPPHYAALGPRAPR